MARTVQHLVHDPQDFPGTMGGVACAFQSSPGYCDGFAADAPARPAALLFASPIRLLALRDHSQCLCPIADLARMSHRSSRAGMTYPRRLIPLCIIGGARSPHSRV